MAGPGLNQVTWLEIWISLDFLVELGLGDGIKEKKNKQIFYVWCWDNCNRIGFSCKFCKHFVHPVSSGSIWFRLPSLWSHIAALSPPYPRHILAISY